MTELEFPRPVRVSNLPEAGQQLRLEATAQECAALAARLGLLALHALSAELRLRAESAGGIRVDGHIEASLEQACVVSLEPVPQRVREPFALRILPEGQLPSEDPDSDDEVECDNGIAELGEVIAQLLALALDPYPRLEGAQLPEHGADDGPRGPFAALAPRLPSRRPQ
jgi:hypothetical protein